MLRHLRAAIDLKGFKRFQEVLKDWHAYRHSFSTTILTCFGGGAYNWLISEADKIKLKDRRYLQYIHHRSIRAHGLTMYHFKWASKTIKRRSRILPLCFISPPLRGLFCGNQSVSMLAFTLRVAWVVFNFTGDQSLLFRFQLQQVIFCFRFSSRFFFLVIP